MITNYDTVATIIRLYQHKFSTREICLCLPNVNLDVVQATIRNHNQSIDCPLNTENELKEAA